jgi:D-alanyl-D-alanine carboxypeptidase
MKAERPRSRRVKLHAGRLFISALVMATAVFCVAGLLMYLFGGDADLKSENVNGGFAGAAPGDLGGEAAGLETPNGRAAAPAETETETGAADRQAGGVSRFSELYYYEEDKLDRYLAYEAAHAEMAPDEVVWRVNARLDRPFYTDISIIEDVDALPVLVNKHYRFPEGYAPEELADIGGCTVTPETRDAFEALKSAAEAAGHRIRAGSAYRSIEYQANLYNRYKNEDGEAGADTYSSRPGHSEHHTGRTVDLIGPAGTLRGFVGTEEAAWVAENAYKYGFIVRYTDENADVTGYMGEPWHITFVGRDAAELMREEGIGSLEEYSVKYMEHRPSG